MKLKLLEKLCLYHLFPESLLVVASRYYLPATFFFLFHVGSNCWKRNKFSWFFILVISKYRLLSHISNLPAAICFREECKKNIMRNKVITFLWEKYLESSTCNITKKLRHEFYVLLTVRLITIFVNDQHDAEFFFLYLFNQVLYMFRCFEQPSAHHQ